MLLTINEVAKELNVSRTHIKKLIESGRVETLVIDDTVLFNDEQFEDIRDLFIIGGAELDYRFETKDEIDNAAVAEFAEFLEETD